MSENDVEKIMEKKQTKFMFGIFGKGLEGENVDSMQVLLVFRENHVFPRRRKTHQKKQRKKDSPAFSVGFWLHFGGHLGDLFATKIDAKIEVDFGSIKNTLVDQTS